ncbi:hypothetical protein Acr_01g0006420 [Actinidia rufa]|uniref:Uncharacterized protein n=1 Tax=Actinidia rufa TaxID=165716 RepID=A0A7J0E2S6_9ERIC|nr:hypothetical protein Acr_01g0006420 [Actinidia rufa]
MASSEGNKGDNPTGVATPIAVDEGQFHHFQGELRRGYPSPDNSTEYLGTIRKRMRKILPHLPDLTLLRLLGDKVISLVHDLESGGSSLSSSSSSEAWSDPWLLPKLRDLVRSTVAPQAQRPGQIHDCSPSSNQMATQKVAEPSDEDLKAHGPIHVPIGPVTRARAKKIKEELNTLVRRVLQ